MRTLDPTPAVSRWIPDTIAVLGMLAATAMAIFALTVFFVLLKRFARPERREVPVSVTTPEVRPGPTDGRQLR
jgi:hypothetical protein